MQNAKVIYLYGPCLRVLGYSGTFDINIEKLFNKKTYFFQQKKCFCSTIGGGGLRTLRTGPQLIGFLRLP